jgi:hypothetical protein
MILSELDLSRLPYLGYGALLGGLSAIASFIWWPLGLIGLPFQNFLIQGRIRNIGWDVGKTWLWFLGFLVPGLNLVLSCILLCKAGRGWRDDG